MGEGERSSARHHENTWEAVAEGRGGEGGIEDPVREDGHRRGFRTPATSPDGPPTAAVDDPISEDSLEAGTLNILEVPSPFGASGAPAELVRALGRLIDTLTAERRGFSAAEERARELEVKTARLEAILVAESEMRRRAEEELSRLRAEIEERRRRIDENVERMLARRRPSAPTATEAEATSTSGRAEVAEPDATAGPAGALQYDRSSQVEPAPTDRARGREGGSPPVSSPATDDAAPTDLPSPSRPAVSHLAGRSDATNLWGPRPPSAKVPASARRREPPPPPTPETIGAPDAATGGTSEGQPPPLLPGWRYASDLEGPPRRRWPWRLRSRDRA